MSNRINRGELTPSNQILQGDALSVLANLPDESVDMVMTSPPYWGLRDYGVEGQLGQEADFRDFIKNLCDVFDEVKRVLKPTGSCWANIGDTYNGSKTGNTNGTGKGTVRQKDGVNTITFSKKRDMTLPNKSLLQIPSRFAIEMVERGWVLRNELIWHKPNAMPDSAKDRFTIDHEKLFFFTKTTKYNFYPQFATAAAGQLRNMRTVWSVNTKPLPDAHIAVYPEELIQAPILAGCPVFGVVLDPFFGSGTTGVVARRLGRKYLGIELNPEYIEIANKRLESAEEEVARANE